MVDAAVGLVRSGDAALSGRINNAAGDTNDAESGRDRVVGGAGEIGGIEPIRDGLTRRA